MQKKILTELKEEFFFIDESIKALLGFARIMVFWGWGRERKLRIKLVNCVVILSDKKQIIERLGYI